LIEKL